MPVSPRSPLSIDALLSRDPPRRSRTEEPTPGGPPLLSPALVAWLIAYQAEVPPHGTHEPPADEG